MKMDASGGRYLEQIGKLRPQRYLVRRIHRLGLKVDSLTRHRNGLRNFSKETNLDIQIEAENDG